MTTVAADDAGFIYEYPNAATSISIFNEGSMGQSGTSVVSPVASIGGNGADIYYPSTIGVASSFPSGNLRRAHKRKG